MRRWVCVLAGLLVGLAAVGCEEPPSSTVTQGPGKTPELPPPLSGASATGGNQSAQPASGAYSGSGGSSPDFSGAGGPPPGQPMPDEGNPYGGENFSGADGPPPGQPMPGEEDPYAGQNFSGAGGPPPGQPFPGEEDPYAGQNFSGAGGPPPGQPLPGQEDPYAGQNFPGAGGPAPRAGGAGQGRAGGGDEELFDQFDAGGAAEDEGEGSAAAPGVPPPGMQGGGPGGAFGGPGRGAAGNRAPSRAPAKEGLAGLIDQAFLEGREKDAFQLLYARALTEEQSPLLSQIRWVPALKRPALAVRFGLGVSLSPPNYQGPLYPIGQNQNIPTRQRGVSGRGGRAGAGPGVPFGGGDPGVPDAPGIPEAGAPAAGGAGGFGGMAGGSRPDELKRLTGELGEKLLAELGTRLQRGDYGQVLKEAYELVGEPQRGGGGGFGGDGFPGYDDDAGGDAAGAGQLPPPGFDAGNPLAGRGPAGGGPRRPAPPQQQQPAHQMLLAGVTFLGTGSPRDLLRQAEQEGVDVLIVFLVQAKPNPRTRLVSTDTRIQVVDVWRGEDIYRSIEVNNIKVQLARAGAMRGANEDPVEEMFTRMFKVLDEDPEKSLVMTDLPPLKPEHVLGRLQMLLQSPPMNPLPILTEIRFYYANDLLRDDHFLAAYQRVLGQLPGEQLAKGNSQQRLAVLKRWLPPMPQ